MKIHKLKILLVSLLMNNMLYGIEYLQKDTLITELKPFNTITGSYNTYNVIQGLASYKNNWIVTQSIKNKKLLINILDKRGNSINDAIIKYPSHGQDLSIEIKNDKLLLYTVSKGGKGILKIEGNISSFKKTKLNLKFKKSVDLNLDGVTPTISEDKNYFIIKSKGRIYIYRYIDIFKNINPESIFSFSLNKKQRKKGQWFQGLAMKDGFIYCLSGDNTLKGSKQLFIYDNYGKLIKMYTLKTGKVLSKSLGKKWELEGLTFKEKSLYTTVISKKDGKHILNLYMILLIK